MHRRTQVLGETFRMPQDKTEDVENDGAREQDAPELLIGDVSKQFEVSPRWLRHLEKFGLLRPGRSGTARLYTRSDCKCIAAILKGRKLGFTLSEIKGLVSNSDGNAPELAISRERCMQQIETLAKQRFELDEAIAELWRIHNHLPARSEDPGG